MKGQLFRLSIKQKAKELTELKGYSASVRIGVFIGLVFWLLFFSATFVKQLSYAINHGSLEYHYSAHYGVNNASLLPDLASSFLLIIMGLLLYSLAYQYYHNYYLNDSGLKRNCLDFFKPLREKTFWLTLLIQLVWTFCLGTALFILSIPVGITIGLLGISSLMPGGSLIVGLLVLVGFVLYLLFLLYVSIRFCFTAIATYDCFENGLIKERGYDYGIRYSWRITKGRVFELVKLWLSLLGWFFLIMITAGIALFFIAPYLVGINVMAYEKLKEDYDHSFNKTLKEQYEKTFANN